MTWTSVMNELNRYGKASTVVSKTCNHMRSFMYSNIISFFNEMFNPIIKIVFFNAITTSKIKIKVMSRDLFSYVSSSVDKHALLLYIKNVGWRIFMQVFIVRNLGFPWWKKTCLKTSCMILPSSFTIVRRLHYEFC